MAVNETEGYGRWGRTAEQIDKEILYSTDGIFRKGGAIAKGQVLEAGTVLSQDEASGLWIAYNNVADVNEQQTLTFGAGTADAGDFKLRITPPADYQPAGDAGPWTTAAIPFNATAADVQTAIRAADDALAGVTVTGSVGGPFVVTFAGDLAGWNVPMIEVVDNTVQDTPVAMALTPTQTQAAVRGGQTAQAILARGVDTTNYIEHVDIYFGGTFKTDKLVGLDANAITDLGATQNTEYGWTRF